MEQQHQRWEKVQAKHAKMADIIQDKWSAIRPYMPPVNFITMHYTYFGLLGLIVSVIFWGASRPSQSISFIDSLFLVLSSFTSSGLNTVNISQLSTVQQVILAIMMILGSPVLISLFTIWFRTRVFEKRFKDIVEMERSRRIKTTGTVIGMAGAMFGTPVLSSFRPRSRRRDQQAPSGGGGESSHTQRADADAFQLSPGRVTVSPRVDRNGDPDITKSPPRFLNPIQEGHTFHVSSTDVEPRSPMSYTSRRRAGSQGGGGAGQDAQRSGGGGGGAYEMFDFKAFVRENKKSIGRNGQFFDLTEEQREYLGGVEYRALKVLFTIVVVYFVLWQVLGAIALGAWLSVHSTSITTVNSQNAWWSGIFLCISSFNNAGMTLLDSGIAAFADDAFVLTISTILSLAGNAAFPAFLRATVFFTGFVLKHTVDEEEYVVWKEAFDFILKYPRRLYTMMFPAKANWVFVGIFSSIAILDWVLLLVLSIGNSVFSVYSVGKQVGLALFQALTIPSGGFAVISVSALYFDLQVLWIVMMYISAYPEIIVMRNSNVYEERSLGIYASDDSSSEDSDSTARNSIEKFLDVPQGPLLASAMSSSTAYPGGPPRTPVSISGVSQAPSRFSTTSAKSIKKLAAIGRRGTAFIGRQVQNRMNDFQGVGVTTKPRLRRAPEVIFDDKPHPVVASEGQVDLVSQHLRGQLSHDIWSIALSLFLITLIETSHSLQDPQAYSVFNFLFEIVSGYTNIGLTIGLPGQAYSFSGGWYTGSKLILVAMMIRGRHRGLPVALDHAVKLPGWDNVKKQDEDAEIRRSLSRNRPSYDG